MRTDPKEKIERLHKKLVTTALLDNEKRKIYGQIAQLSEIRAQKDALFYLVDAVRWYEAAGEEQKAISGYRNLANIYMAFSPLNPYIMYKVIDRLKRLGLIEEARGLEKELEKDPLCRAWSDAAIERENPEERYLRRILEQGERK